VVGFIFIAWAEIFCSGSYGPAAVDVDDLASDVGRRRHAEEGHHGCHLHRLAGPPHRDPG